MLFFDGVYYRAFILLHLVYSLYRIGAAEEDMFLESSFKFESQNFVLFGNCVYSSSSNFHMNKIMVRIEPQLILN